MASRALQGWSEGVGHVGDGEAEVAVGENVGPEQDTPFAVEEGAPAEP